MKFFPFYFYIADSIFNSVRNFYFIFCIQSTFSTQYFAPQHKIDFRISLRGEIKECVHDKLMAKRRKPEFKIVLKFSYINPLHVMYYY